MSQVSLLQRPPLPRDQLVQEGLPRRADRAAGLQLGQEQEREDQLRHLGDAREGRQRIHDDMLNYSAVRMLNEYYCPYLPPILQKKNVVEVVMIYLAYVAV